MKKFLSGVLCTTLVFSLAISALAISGRMTIEVDPINVQVNGEVFQPTDVNGKEVPVFAYQGTTYAPLRALAESYGLEVGYDAEANMATVTDPDVKTPDTTTPDTTANADYSDWSAEDEAAYQEFKGMWSVTIFNDGYITLHSRDNGKDPKLLDAFLINNDIATTERYCLRFDEELYAQYNLEKITYHYETYGDWGWMDRMEQGGWSCGYGKFATQTMKKAA